MLKLSIFTVYLSHPRFIVSTAHMGVNPHYLIEGFIIPDTKAETLRYLYDIYQMKTISV